MNSRKIGSMFDREIEHVTVHRNYPHVDWRWNDNSDEIIQNVNDKLNDMKFRMCREIDRSHTYFVL